MSDKTITIVRAVTIEETFVAVEAKPLRVAPRLRAQPSIRQFYWCDFPEDAQLPEFWKTRPVIILSFKNTLGGAVTVVPCSSQSQEGNPWAVRLPAGIDGGPSWAICDKITTVAVSRLSQQKTMRVPRLNEDTFNVVLAKVLDWLPKLPVVAPVVVAVPAGAPPHGPQIEPQREP